MESFARAGLSALVAALALSAPLTGTFALLGGTAKATAELRVGADGSQTRLDLIERAVGSARPILVYQADMTKLIHLVIVSDDFTQFMHVHPAFNSRDGHFTIDVPLKSTRRYYVYADTQPKGMTQQVFRFTVGPSSGAVSSQNPTPAMTPSARVQRLGPYTVKLGTTTLPANAAAGVYVTVDKNGRLANDLQTYLGAAAHAVFIDTASLTYVHVHPMLVGETNMNMGAMNDMHGPGKAGPRMMMEVPGLPVGTYKLWLQFRGGRTVQTVPFTIVAR